VRDLARRVLTHHGYRVLEAANAGEAFLICEKHPKPIHLMITDMVMPQMDGEELAKRVGALRPEMKVIYMSGHTDPEVLKKVTERGTPFLLKPFRADALARKIRDVLGAAQP
jgi:DNA-binding NtrC family response regulator